MYEFRQLLKRDLLNLFFNPMWLSYGTVFPYLLVLILGFLASGGYGGNITSYDYYGVCMLIYIVFNSSTIAANSFMEERIREGNMRLIYSPLPVSFIYYSKVLATFIFSSLCHLFTLFILWWTLNVNYGGDRILSVIALLVIFEFFSCSLGVLICTMFRRENTTNQVLFIIISLMSILGGLFFRIDGMGKTISDLSRFSLVKWILTDLFQIIYDHNFILNGWLILILLGSSFLFLILCRLFFRTEDYL